MLILDLAWRDLLRDRVFVICNIAMMVGILVPLLLLFGVKNGVFEALLGEMMADPANLQIDTAGNASLSDADLAPLGGWPEIAFMTPKTRSQFDFINVRPRGGRRIRSALMIPSGTGDPTLPPQTVLEGQGVAVSAQLAGQLDLAVGDAVQLVTQAEGRPRQLVLPATVAAVLLQRAAAGRAVLAPYPMLDLIEAFYDDYSLPDHGIEARSDLDQRVASYEGVRVYARRLEELAPLQARLETQLGLSTNARTREVEALLGLGRKLNLALTLTAALAALGLGAALTLGFWSDVARKQQVLAAIALLGVPAAQLSLFPLIQALITATCGLCLSFLAYIGAARAATALFGQGLPGESALVMLSGAQIVAICAAVLALVLGASGLAAWRVQRLDPAIVLRSTP